MPGATMQDESEYRLPKDLPMQATLEKVEEKTFPYVKDGQDRTFTKWEWDFLITDGEFAGLHAWGETEAKLTNHPDNKVRQWAETLRGSEFAMGEGLDTDDLLQLPCVILVDNRKEPKKGTTDEFYYKTPVVDVLPSDISLEPPF